MRILLIISGSVAAYKSLDLIRNLKERGASVTTVLTKGGEQFVTPLSVAALSGAPVYTDLFSLKDETEMGHIRLSREADLILVVPASANLLAKMASGIADDLASTILLATDKPVYAAPAMNHRMWAHPATQRNVAQLKKDGITFIGPDPGALACGEEGEGRMCSPDAILSVILGHAAWREPGIQHKHAAPAAPLSGRTALVTSGPTHEPIDPVRFLGNRSSGKQGHAIAEALARAGAKVTLVTGPTALPSPAGVTTIPVTTAAEMLAACEKQLPVDIAVFAAAVADWSAAPAPHKIKKRANGAPPE
ncbi:MAG: bifunctional phosphopantothenoylcysteine decarboxylase/phosphopantothenate--cysteine ligase CoaBC, partial [Alphaproteobacteria bacterium]|nr:bifunctional phosphopantothenoylcysteine decarboxylase/phosphopantothenate--cysteine ligase CoaBC [Alphaproteobacteria bacterium]